MSDELTFNPSANDDAPDSPILLKTKREFNDNQQEASNYKVHPRFNWISDELVFSASDNDDAPDSPMLFQMKIINSNQSKTHV